MYIGIGTRKQKVGRIKRESVKYLFKYENNEKTILS